ncbi:Zn-ribbon domain-containing OB-fold protein [Hydrogenophaga sp. NFH-34]|uniref:Zn-ribbon domain-containing OB-fold protein n=1 Tax=Hydrogenophaga sp. NFH-34 TaxID=2744446 RepID=UPI001F3C53FB|nr:zinc ribbon domain-containing protein [Hydrogenophaga sp. NFH-34]
MIDQLTSLKPLHPTLYQLASDGTSLDFIFSQCLVCGTVNFPANVPGCSHCGNPLTEAPRLTRPGQGELLEFVTIHVPLIPDMQAPAIAGDIRIADGIVEEGVIGVKDDSGLRTGMTLKAIAEVREAQGVYACVFVPMNEEVAT